MNARLVLASSERWKRVGFLLTSILLFVPMQLAAAEQLTIVALGASNTAGYGVAPAQAYPAQLEAMLRARGIRARIINAGINGDTVKGMLARLDSAVVPGTQLVILDATRNGFGGAATSGRATDDKQQRREQWEAYIVQIRDRLKARGIRTIVTFPFRYYFGLRQPDRIHLSPEAHAKLAARLVPEVMAVIESR
jgi:acyl-CoA thioesterase-1